MAQAISKAAMAAIAAYVEMTTPPPPGEAAKTAEQQYTQLGKVGVAAKCDGDKTRCEQIAAKAWPSVDHKSQKSTMLSGLYVCNSMALLIKAVNTIRDDAATYGYKQPGFTAAAKRTATQIKKHGAVDIADRMIDVYTDDVEKAAKKKAQAATPAGQLDTVDAAIEKLTAFTPASLRAFKAAMVVAAGSLVELPVEVPAASKPKLAAVEPVAEEEPAADPMDAIRAMQKQLAAMLDAG